MSESMMERALKESCKIELQAVIDERHKWIKAIGNIKADIEQERDGLYEEKANDYLRGINEAHLTDLNIITKHTKELMK